MNVIKHWQALCACCFCMAVCSCDGTDPEKDTPHSVLLLGIEATTNIDLSARKDWTLSVYQHPYTFEIDGGTLLAAPQNSDNLFAFEVTANNKTGHAILTFMARDYFQPGQSSALPANLSDQSTPEKLLSRDVLRADYTGTANENISVSLFHENALLMFNTNGLPDDAEVYIYESYNKQTITPLRDAADPTAYKALVFPNNHLFTLYAVVKANGKEYGQMLRSRHNTRMNISFPDGIGHSAIVTFTISIDENDELLVENLVMKTFQKDWPVIP